jgi:hypothetical protein
MNRRRGNRSALGKQKARTSRAWNIRSEPLPGRLQKVQACLAFRPVRVFGKPVGLAGEVRRHSTCKFTVLPLGRHDVAGVVAGSGVEM